MKQAAIRHGGGEGSEARRTTLPPDILQAASRRVGWAALILAGLWVMATLAGKLSRALGETEAMPREFRMTLVGIILVLSVAVFLLSRRRERGSPSTGNLAGTYTAPPPPPERARTSLCMWASAAIRLRNS